MNPLNVLRGASLLRPVQDLRKEGDELLLDWSGQSRVTLDASGRPKRVTVNGVEGRLMPYEDDMDLASLGREDIVTATPDIIMRSAIEIRQQTGTPIVFLEDGKMIGVIGDDEIYRGILRQTAIAEAAEREKREITAATIGHTVANMPLGRASTDGGAEAPVGESALSDLDTQ